MRCRLIVPQIISFYTRFSLSNHKFTSLSNPATFVCHIRLIVCETQIGAKSFDRTSHCFIILSDHKSKFFSNPSIFVYRTSSICLSAPNRRRSYVCALMSALLCRRSIVGRSFDGSPLFPLQSRSFSLWSTKSLNGCHPTSFVSTLPKLNSS